MKYKHDKWHSGWNQYPNAVINIGLVRLPHRNWSSIGRGAPQYQLKKRVLIFVLEFSRFSIFLNFSSGISNILGAKYDIASVSWYTVLIIGLKNSNNNTTIDCSPLYKIFKHLFMKLVFFFLLFMRLWHITRW